jgi:YaaC-like protein
MRAHSLAGNWPTPLDLNSWEWKAGNPQATVYLRREDMPEDGAAWRTLFREIMITYPAADGWAIPAEAGAITAEDTVRGKMWWLLLYTFSMLARYQPRAWAKLLDLDQKDGPAALLRYALTEALNVIPHLVLEALDRQRSLLAKPMEF